MHFSDQLWFNVDYEYTGEGVAVLPYYRGGVISPEANDVFKGSYASMGIENGLIVSPFPLESNSLIKAEEDDIDTMTYEVTKK